VPLQLTIFRGEKKQIRPYKTGRLRERRKKKGITSQRRLEVIIHRYAATGLGSTGKDYVGAGRGGASKIN